MNYLFKLSKNMQQRQFEKSVWIYPIKLAMYATYLKHQGHHVMWDYDGITSENYIVINSEDQINVPFLDLPAPDRFLTDAMNPKWQSNGNFKHKPGTYILAAEGCWWGRCTFCVEKGKHYTERSVDSVINEIRECKEQGFREVFDDSATFPDGEWLREFCQAKIELCPDMPISCNMRIGANVDFKMMKQAGFRMLLYGVESASQYTLKKIKKGINHERIASTIKQAAEAGLAPHIAVMFGYPWEKDRDSRKTVRLVRSLLKDGYAKTAQASIYAVEGKERNKQSERYIRMIFNRLWTSPKFWWNRFKDIKTKDDIKYLGRQIKEGISCLMRY